MRRWDWFVFCLFLIPISGEAGVPRNVPPLDDTLLRNFLKSLSDHLNTLECLTADPNGSVLGVHGELKCASFGGDDYVCMNTGTGPSKTTEWTCVNISDVGGGGVPEVVVFCPSTLSTAMNCENFRGRMPAPCTLSRVDAAVRTAPTGASLLIDVNECTTPTSCTSLWSVTQGNRLAITASSLTGSQTSFDDLTIAEGNLVGIDIDQVGSTVVGSHLTVNLLCQ